MSSHFLYKITNQKTGKSYIGVTKNFSRRVASHLSGSGSSEIAKDLKDGFTSQILLIGSERYVYDMEPQAINLYNTLTPYGYNKGRGGEGGNTSKRLGELNTQAVLCEKDVLNIRTRAANKEPHESLALEFKVTREAISTLVRGDSWKHVGGPLTKRKLITQEDIDNFLALKAEGLNAKQISEKTGWSKSTIWKYLQK